MVVQPEQMEWPARDGRATRYCLIGRLSPADPWTYFGFEQTQRSMTERTEPVPTATLELAVNRPRLGERAPGDPGWQVTVAIFEPSSIGPIEDQELCAILECDIAARRDEAPRLCSAIGVSIEAIEGRWEEIFIAWRVAGAALIALVAAALPVWIPATGASAASVQAAIRTAQALLRPLIRTIAPPGVVGASFGAVVAEAVALPTLLISSTAATASAGAASSPATFSLFGTIVIAALAIIAAAAVAASIGLLLSLIDLHARNGAARAAWADMLRALQADLDEARTVCANPLQDTSLPTCASLEG